MAGNHKKTSREGSARQQMSLAIHFHPTGHHVAAWLHPRSQIDAGSNAAHYLKMAQTAERGKFDLIFLADSLAIRESDLRAEGSWPRLDREHELQRAIQILRAGSPLSTI